MTQSFLATVASSIRSTLDQDISFEQALVLENVIIDAALVLEGEQRDAFVRAAQGEHPTCSSRWVELE